MTDEQAISIQADEGIPSITPRALLANVLAITILFVGSRLVRALWSELAGDASYWLLGCYALICLVRLRIDLFPRVRNRDTSFVLNMIVSAAASFAFLTGLRIATAPLIMRAIKFMS
jgi:hypothetical protein